MVIVSMYLLLLVLLLQIELKKKKNYKNFYQCSMPLYQFSISQVYHLLSWCSLCSHVPLFMRDTHRCVLRTHDLVVESIENVKYLSLMYTFLAQLQDSHRIQNSWLCFWKGGRNFYVHVSQMLQLSWCHWRIHCESWD